MLEQQSGTTTLEQRKAYAAKAFSVVAHYDIAITQYFNPGGEDHFTASFTRPTIMRYGENPHQSGVFFGNLEEIFTQLNGKELSYNNLVDVDAAVQLMNEFNDPESTEKNAAVFGIIKHTNVCGIASRPTVFEAWEAALSGDPESAFGGVLSCNREIDAATAEAIQEIFFEVLIAPGFSQEAVTILSAKKNRILLQQKKQFAPAKTIQIPAERRLTARHRRRQCGQLGRKRRQEFHTR